MNATQLLKVATKVCINCDLEAKWEVSQRLKKKADLLAVFMGERMEVLKMEGAADVVVEATKLSKDSRISQGNVGSNVCNSKRII